MNVKYYDKQHRIKKIREIANLSRKQLAAKIAMLYITYVKTENGKLPLTKDTAFFIAMATGSHPDWLMGKVGKSEHALAWHGQPYNVETYKRWDKGNKELTYKPIEVMIKELGTTTLIYKIVQLFRVAERKCKYEALNHNLNLHITNLADTLDLSKFLINETIPFLADGHAAVTQFGSRHGKLASSQMIDAPDISDKGVYRKFTAAHRAHKGFKAKISYNDPTKIIKMQATLSPLFLFKLGEWAGAGEWGAIKDEIDVARGALNLLESKLSKA